MDKFPIKILGGGAAMLALVTALGWGGVSMIIRGQLKQQAKLWNKTDTWRSWQDSPSPYYLRIYFFNLENAEEIAKGMKPKLAEKGPYVYMESRWKEDIEFDKGNDTLLYKQMRKYSFMPEMSDGHKEEDMITTLNVPLIGMARIAQDSTDKDKMLGSVNSKTSAEQLFVKHSVKDLLFEGYDVKAYEELGTEHNGAMSESGGDFMVPEYLMDGKYSFFENRNLTDNGIWEVWSGRTNASAAFLIKTWNSIDMLPWWSKGEPCHSLNGTDGTIFVPPRWHSTILKVYESEYCRSRKYEFEMPSMVKEVKTVRYKPKKQHMLSPQNNPDNACYCQYEDLAKCGKDGIETLSPCMDGIPMFISNPHFFNADKEVIDSVEGLSPDPEKHETHLDIDPISGLIFEGKRRWQISLEVEPVSQISALASAPKAYIPIYWIEESYMAPDKKFSLMKFLAMIQQGCDTIRWGLLFIAIGIILVGLIIALTRRGSSKVDRITLLQ